MTAPLLDRSQPREHILHDFQSITGLNIEDSIHFLDQYNWQLKDIVHEYYRGIDVKQATEQSSDLGRFYSSGKQSEQADVDADRYYAELLQVYGDSDQQSREERRVTNTAASAVSTTAEPIYHERQRLMRCGLHSLNNLFQIPKLFTSHYLESIVKEFDTRTFFNDYRALWVGNYDLRILIEAIRRFGFDVRQINIYGGERLADLPWDSYFGLLVNLNGQHWFTIKNLRGIYHNLDSTLRKPLEIGQKQHLIDYLIRLIQNTSRVYLFVVTQQVG